MTKPPRKSRAAAALLLAAASVSAARAATPIDGFLPMVGIALTNEFSKDFEFSPTPMVSPGGTLLGPGGVPHYDVALLDTGAGFSLLTSASFDAFALGSPSPGESDGYRGTETITIGGATGQLDAVINDPFGLYATGLQNRTAAGSSLALNNAVLQGQTNTATITLPAESTLPNVVGLPFASQYATRIRNDLPQVFELGGRTIRTPAVEFLARGSGGGGITRKAQLTLSPGSSFSTPPVYLPNITNFNIDRPNEDPSIPTLVQGALFVNASAIDASGSLSTRPFFLDTGASVTVVSQFNALALGFDVTTDTPEFTSSVVGSGGTVENVPGFYVDSITIPALGGSVTFTHVPVLVLDVTNPADPGNVVEGILGTNLFAGRNLVIDPNPSIGGGGASAGLYISDPVTTGFTWTAAAASAPWDAAASWNAVATPTYLSSTTLQASAGASKEAVVSGQQRAADIEVGGGAGSLTVRLSPGSTLTAFSGATVDSGGGFRLQAGSRLDVQYLEVRGGLVSGTGLIRTGSGPIAGQVEVVGGVLAPGDGVGRLEVDGNLTLGAGATTQMAVGGPAAGTETDQLVIDGSVVFGGTLDVTLGTLGAGLFQPHPGDRFTLVTYQDHGGVFDAVNLPAGYNWQLSYGATSLVLSLPGVAGDYNGDGRVNAADYTVWRDGLGTTFASGHYQQWADNYGVAGASTAASGSISVPEPALGAVLILAAGVARTRRYFPQ